MSFHKFLDQGQILHASFSEDDIAIRFALAREHAASPAPLLWLLILVFLLPQRLLGRADDGAPKLGFACAAGERASRGELRGVPKGHIVAAATAGVFTTDARFTYAVWFLTSLWFPALIELRTRVRRYKGMLELARGAPFSCV